MKKKKNYDTIKNKKPHCTYEVRMMRLVYSLRRMESFCYATQPKN